MHESSEQFGPQSAAGRAAAFRRSLLSLTQDLLARDVADGLYGSALELAVAHIPGADAGSVLVRGTDGLFRFEAVHGFDLAPLASIAFSSDDLMRRSPPGVEVIVGVGEHHLLPPNARRLLETVGRLHDIRATLSVPVVVHGDTVAYLNLDSLQRTDAFDREAIESGSLLGGLIGALVQRLSLESALRLERSKLATMAYHDPLTGLPNRLLLSDRLEQAIGRDRRNGRRTALIVLDLDGFKTINDTFGHAVGDHLLVAIGARLRETLRDVDTVARIGGDAFAVVAAGLADPIDADTVVQKVVSVVSSAYAIADREVLVGGSVGVGIAPKDGGTAGALMQSSDLAMYRVKREGRGAVAYFTADLDTGMRARAQLTEDLRLAIQSGGLDVVFQPRVHLGDGRPVGVEALARWTHPSLGPVPPMEFVALAEDAGLANQLGAAILERACGALAAWRAEGRAVDGRMAVNVSGHQLRSGELDVMVLETLARHGLPPSVLDLEVTESAMLDERAQMLAPLQRLRRAGVRIAIDDFGTGYSSLHRLAVLPVDILKIDRSFVAGLGRFDRDAAVIDAILALAHGLGLEAVAEGVESEVQRQELLASGCIFAQGFLFAKPLSATSLATWLDARTCEPTGPSVADATTEGHGRR